MAYVMHHFITTLSRHSTDARCISEECIKQSTSADSNLFRRCKKEPPSTYSASNTMDWVCQTKNHLASLFGLSIDACCVVHLFHAAPRVSYRNRFPFFLSIKIVRFADKPSLTRTIVDDYYGHHFEQIGHQPRQICLPIVYSSHIYYKLKTFPRQIDSSLRERIT